MSNKGLAETLNYNSESALKDKVDSLLETVSNLMNIVIKIPELVDERVEQIYSKVNDLELKMKDLEYKYENLCQPRIDSKKNYAQAPPKPPIKKPERETPQSLRGSIMSELKEVFKKRKGPF